MKIDRITIDSLIRVALTALLAVLWGGSAASAAGESAAWAALRSGGHIALMRHALAPGTGDPANFDVADCGTQRNLSQEGRDQAARIGEQARANGLSAALVRSSQWCRCLETAELLGLGPAEVLPALNSFFRSPERGLSQTQAVETWIGEQALDQPVILVTHQVNITALTGVYPRSGEILIVAPSPDGSLAVIDRLLIE